MNRAGLTLFFLLAILAACTPRLDTTGAIRCPGAGTCPEGFVCRWERCCPSGSDAGACPAALPDDNTGQSYAPIGGQCPGGYEERFGRCCPTGSGGECPTRVLGAHCQQDSDCDSPATGVAGFCITNQLVPLYHENFSSGYCSAMGCGPLRGCGTYGTCSAGFCLRACNPPFGSLGGECPGSAGSQVCVRFSPAIAACFPDCSQNVSPPQCTPPSTCVMPLSGIHFCAVRCPTGFCDPGFTCSAGQICIPNG